MGKRAACVSYCITCIEYILAKLSQPNSSGNTISFKAEYFPFV